MPFTLPAVLTDRPVIDLSGLRERPWRLESARLDREAVPRGTVRLNARFAVLVDGKVHFMIAASKQTT